MSNYTVILLCIAVGLMLQRVKRFPEGSAVTLNLYVIYVALPALVLSEIPNLMLNREALLPVIAVWLVMAFSAGLTWLTARALDWSKPVTGSLMLLVPLGNTGFVGLPLIDTLVGREGIPYAILYDNLGTFIALNTYGILVAAYYSGRSASAGDLVRNILTFPSFLALCLAFATYPLDYPDWLASAFATIAASLVPVVMVAVGMQWKLRLERETATPFLMALGFKLLLIPAVTLGALLLFGFEGLAARVVVLEAAMPAMISAGALATIYGLAPRLSSAVVGYGLAIGLVTVPLWHWVVPL
ncbi:AEC family transporter [Marinimicrobium alkaliphilum]|uniref:AEC family transporter n=1 Tax=Marinimicrobium alkaliphilum TaxID=2202654 RepID=UPI000DB95D57|nr:AEC family transporter [Marinimicrobium alkaliphilum]